MHWVKWSKLCEPKEKGGLNFRDMKIFNEALLAKQVWRFHTNSESMVARAFKDKYYPNFPILEATLGHCSSLAWQSIWGAKAIIKEGIIW